MNKTPLYQSHKALGAKIIDFGEWQMPVSYSSVIKEHEIVRSSCGAFDVSHMGEIFISGDQAQTFIQRLTINDATAIKVGFGQYTAMCNEAGGVLDDLFCYRLDTQRFLLCVNASNTEKISSWVKKKKIEFSLDVDIVDDSHNWAQIALQGPSCNDVLENSLFKSHLDEIKKLSFTEIKSFSIDSTPIYVARTGYTGEKGYELYIPQQNGAKIWDALIEAGAKPIGLGARDTLRLEACYPLYGNDLNEEATPIETGIGWAVKLDTAPFVGSQVLGEQKRDGAKKSAKAFIMQDQGIPRSGMAIYQDGKKVGTVTSGSFLPTLKKPGGLCLVFSSLKVGDLFEIDIRGKRKKAKLVKKPLYQPRVKS